MEDFFITFFKVMAFIYSVIMWTQYKFTKKATSGTSKYKMNFNRIKNSRGDRRKIGVDIDETVGLTGVRSQNRAYFFTWCSGRVKFRPKSRISFTVRGKYSKKYFCENQTRRQTNWGDSHSPGKMFLTQPNLKLIL